MQRAQYRHREEPRREMRRVQYQPQEGEDRRETQRARYLRQLPRRGMQCLYAPWARLREVHKAKVHEEEYLLVLHTGKRDVAQQAQLGTERQDAGRRVQPGRERQAAVASLSRSLRSGLGMRH